MIPTAQSLKTILLTLKTPQKMSQISLLTNQYGRKQLLKI